MSETNHEQPQVMSLDADCLSAEAALAGFEYDRKTSLGDAPGAGYAVYFAEEWAPRLLVTMRRLARLCEQAGILPPPEIWNALRGDDTGPGGRDRNTWGAVPEAAVAPPSVPTQVLDAGVRICVRSDEENLVAYLAPLETMEGAEQLATLNLFALAADGEGRQGPLFSDWIGALTGWLERQVAAAAGVSRSDVGSIRLEPGTTEDGGGQGVS
jgi:hypothetical protein